MAGPRGPQPQRSKRVLNPPKQQPRKKQPTRNKYNKIVVAPPRIPAGLSKSHHFDAFSPGKPQALAFAIGPATHVNGARRFVITIPGYTGGNQNPSHTIARFQPGGGFDQWVTTQFTPGSAGAAGSWSPVETQTINSTGILSDGNFTATNPTHVMCSRGSLRIRNMTRTFNVSGSVQVLRQSIPLPSMISTQDLYTAIKDLIEESTSTVVMTGQELARSHQWDCVPVTQSAYTSFHEPVSGEVERLDPGLSSVFLLFEHASQQQEYEISMASCYYARYNIVGPLSNLGKPPPVAPLSIVNNIRAVAESIGSFGRPLAARVAAGMLPQIADAVGQRAGTAAALALLA